MKYLIKNKENLVYSIEKHGHRELYIKVFKQNYNIKVLINETSFLTIVKLIRTKGVLIFITIEDCFITYLISSIIRAVLKKSTLGLSLEVIKDESKITGLKWYKRKILQLNKKNQYIETISILPFYKNSIAEKIYKYWIYDPALWDLQNGNNIIENENIVDTKAKIHEKGKIVILFLGTVCIRKGFDFYVELMKQAQKKNSNDYKFIAAGPVNTEVEEKINEFKKLNGILIDKRLSESEVLLLQNKCNILWACYVPTFDQSSGICGRALQLDKTVIVRKNSVAEKQINKYTKNIINTEYDNIEELWENITKFKFKEKKHKNKYIVQKMKKNSLDKLSEIINK